ncbi:MAG: integrase [Chloroflexi bacterium]|nr:integrase [Chloroflexota bacterium]
MLGRSQIAVTLDLYSHVRPAMQRRAVEALEAVLSG